MFIAPVYKPKNLKSIQVMVWHGNRTNWIDTWKQFDESFSDKISTKK